MDNFCIFILSHERPDRVRTIRSLEKAGYTGPWRVVVDDQDSCLEAYRERFEDQLLTFNKDAVAPRVDLADNFKGKQTPLYAREKVWDWAREMGLKHFMVMDDDYDYFRYKINPDGTPRAESPWFKNLDAHISLMREYMQDSSVDCLAFSQGGDWFGGTPGTKGETGYKTKRKAMNAFLFDTGNKIEFLGRFNDDVNTYVVHGNRGRIFLTLYAIKLNQEETQGQPGGITEAYKKYGTYVKSFYTVMHAPSCTDIQPMGQNHNRWHHRISWRNAVPRIISERHKKERGGAGV